MEWNGKAFALGLALGGAILFGFELAPMLRDPSLRFALDRPATRSPGETVDDFFAMIAFFTALGVTVELVKQAKDYAEAELR